MTFDQAVVASDTVCIFVGSTDMVLELNIDGHVTDEIMRQLAGGIDETPTGKGWEYDEGTRRLTLG